MSIVEKSSFNPKRVVSRYCEDLLFNKTFKEVQNGRNYSNRMYSNRMADNRAHQWLLFCSIGTGKNPENSGKKREITRADPVQTQSVDLTVDALFSCEQKII
ncbi:MAG: hypothetical protein V1851_00805 [Patescibacteria group bacterium]